MRPWCLPQRCTQSAQSTTAQWQPSRRVVTAAAPSPDDVGKTSTQQCPPRLWVRVISLLWFTSVDICGLWYRKTCHMETIYTQYVIQTNVTGCIYKNSLTGCFKSNSHSTPQSSARFIFMDQQNSKRVSSWPVERYVCMYVCPKIYTQRAFKLISDALRPQTNKWVFRARLKRSVEKSAERM